MVKTEQKQELVHSSPRHLSILHKYKIIFNTFVHGFEINMKRVVNIYLICSIIFTMFLLASCKGGQSSPENSAEKTHKKLKLVEIPSMMTDPESRSKYAAEHFWDKFDFTDSTYLFNKDSLNEYIATYLQILSFTTSDVADKSLSGLSSKFLIGDLALCTYFMEILEEALYSPNSNIRNETLYISYLKHLVASKHIDPIIKEKFTFQLELALKNRPGAASIDFKYIDNKNQASSLYKTTGKYILVFFYEPGCPSCKEIKQGILDSPMFGSIGNNITYLAVYTGENYNDWKESFETFPENWIVAHDINQELINNKLYDLRASPTMYLLDNSHKVLLKDPDLFQLDNYLSTLL